MNQRGWTALWTAIGQLGYAWLPVRVRMIPSSDVHHAKLVPGFWDSSPKWCPTHGPTAYDAAASTALSVHALQPVSLAA